MHVTFLNMLSTAGADWEMVANVIGLTGPNGRHVCPFCEIMLSNINKGVLHSPVLFQKYTNIGPISPELYENRMLENMSHLAMQFKESGDKKDNAKNYKNCENTHLISAKGTPVSHVSVMPLHLSRGIGLQFINIVENAAVSLDIEIIGNKNGLTSDGIIESYNKQRLFETEKNAKMEVDEMNKQLTTLQKQKADIENKHPEHFVKYKENGKLEDHSSNAKATRKRTNLIPKEIKQLEEKVKTFNKIVSIKTAELKLLSSLTTLKGLLYKTKFDDLMDSLKLKRQVYHSGALVGDDIEKLDGKSYRNNLVKFSRVFTSITIQLSDGTSKMFSSHMLKQKPPCRMCVQYRGGAQYRGGLHEYHGGYLE